MTECEPIVAGKIHFGDLVNSDGQEIPLQQGEDGRMMLSTEAMNALVDEFGNKPPPNRTLILLKSAEKDDNCKKLCDNWRMMFDNTSQIKRIETFSGNLVAKGFSFSTGN